MNFQNYEIVLNNNNPQFDVKTAISLAVLCELAYSDNETIVNTCQNWGYANSSMISVTKGSDIDTQAFVMANEQNLVIAFRGTSDIADWKTNIRAERQPGPLFDTLAHVGFQEALYPAVLPLINAVNQHRTQQQNIWITGHSLGGALCSLFAGMLIENSIPVTAIYTFASPRPADKAFANQLNAALNTCHFRVANQEDLIPHLPPEPLFAHSGQRVILKPEQQVCHEHDSWLLSQVDAIKHFADDISSADSLVDFHVLNGGPQSYIPRLKNLLNN
ncbi:lipase [Saccharobesus litoralis]|uniref:Lipase n=1 Tax=Saccharobesus litoralis TaxID=2172099 RepID=A0A2S0VWR0_9ALTE|nr:lipase family protein [Saccharobesus litoralis]AWB68612.1 lipase [Saccharobesus litoralis]